MRTAGLGMTTTEWNAIVRYWFDIGLGAAPIPISGLSR